MKAQGIDGLEGRAPIGAMLTVGRRAGPGDKERAGTPIRKDRFFFVVPRASAVSGVPGGIKPLHPSFGPFNRDDLPREKVCRVRGRLVHADVGDAAAWYLRAQQAVSGKKPDGSFKTEATPSGRPWCVGDGKQATRITWDAEGRETERVIVCPNEACEFRLGSKAACKPFASLLFVPEFPEAAGMPAVLTRWTTSSWHTARNLIGFVERLHEAARDVGMPSFPVLGMPFEMVVSEATSSKDGGRRFPVVSITPTADPVTWLIQARQRAQLAGIQAPALLTVRDLSDEDDREAFAAITPGAHSRLPMRSSEPEPEVIVPGERDSRFDDVDLSKPVRPVAWGEE